jgi:hypothetical protein
VQAGVAVVHAERRAGAGFWPPDETSAPASSNMEVRMRDTIAELAIRSRSDPNPIAI